MAPSSLFLGDPLRSRTKLRHLRQGAPCHSQIPQTLASVPHRSTPPNHNSHQPCQSAILEGTEENKLEDSKRVPRAIGVQFRTKTYSRNKERQSRCLIMKK